MSDAWGPPGRRTSPPAANASFLVNDLASVRLLRADAVAGRSWQRRATDDVHPSNTPDQAPADRSSRCGGLRARTFEMELLFSGAVVFGLMQVPPPLAAASRRILDGVAGDLRLIAAAAACIASRFAVRSSGERSAPRDETGERPRLRYDADIMKVILFGASGMVGQGVLRECLLAADVESVLAIGRAATGTRHAKLREIVHADFTDFTPLERELAGHDACFFCLGVSAAGMSEAEYSRVTYDVTLAAATLLERVSPQAAFVYVSGTGTDASERGRIMWARVKGRTENALLALPFRAAYMFRPGIIRPLHGIVSRTRAYRIFYTLAGPLLPLLKALFPNSMTTTEQLGRAMLHAARRGAPRRVLETRDINALASLAT